MTGEVDLRFTHPTMYRSAIIFALISVGLGLNFLLTHPTFNAYDINKDIVGAIFLTLGFIKLIAIIILKDLKIIRLSMAMCAGFMMFWGIGNALLYFSGLTSLQLFVLYSGLTILQLLMLLEPFINLSTMHNGK